MLSGMSQIKGDTKIIIFAYVSHWETADATAKLVYIYKVLLMPV